MVMKDDRKDIKEPYSPENTPNPPQIIDPSQKHEQNENDAPVENSQEGSQDKQNNQGKAPKDKSKKPGRQNSK